MATYYKYEKADDISKSMIDWSGLTKTISDNLMGEKKRRDDLKQKHDVDNAKQLQEIEKFEQGLDPTLNAKMLEYSQSYKQYLLENHKLMKRGLITVNDSMLIKQNASDSWANMNAATKNFNQNIKAVIDKGGNVNDFKAKFAAELFDFKDKKLFINDQGVASVANVDDKGNIDKNTLVPWTTLNNTILQPHETFDLKTKVAAAITNTAKAEWTTAPSPYLSITDQRTREKEFKEWKKNTITSVLAGESTLIAAAADQDMEPTKDKALVESNPEKYFLAEVVNGEIKFSLDSTQEEKLREKVGNEIEMSLGRTEVRKAPPQETAAQTRARLGSADEKDTFSLITKALQGDEFALQDLATTYKLKSIRPKGNGEFEIVKPNNEVDVIKTSGNISQAGGTFAAALGLNARNYVDQVKITDSVSSRFGGNIDTVDYTKIITAPQKTNTEKNKLALGVIVSETYNEEDKGDNARQKARDFKSYLAAIIPDAKIKPDVNPATGEVTVNGKSVGFMDNSGEVLQAIDNLLNTPKTTAADILKEKN